MTASNNDYNYNLNYTMKKDPNQDYSGFGYAMNNLLRSGALNNGLSGLFGGYGNSAPYSHDSQGMYSNLTPFLADYFFGNKYRTNDTNPYMNFNSFPQFNPYMSNNSFMNQNNDNNSGQINL